MDVRDPPNSGCPPFQWVKEAHHQTTQKKARKRHGADLNHAAATEKNKQKRVVRERVSSTEGEKSSP